MASASEVVRLDGLEASESLAGALVLLDLWEAAAIVFFFIASEWLQAWCVHHTARRSHGIGGLLQRRDPPARAVLQL